MHVKFVELEQGHAVHDPQHVLLGDEVARHVQHQPAVGKAGTVGHVHGGDGPFGPRHRRQRLDGGRQGQAQRLQGIERAGISARLDAHTGLVHVQAIGFGSQVVRPFQPDVAVTAHSHLQREACGADEKRTEVFGQRLQSFVADRHDGRRRDAERSRDCGCFHRTGNNAYRCRFLGPQRAGEQACRYP